MNGQTLSQGFFGMPKVDLMVIDRQGKAYHLKDCKVETSLTPPSEEEKEYPRSFSCSFEIQGGTELLNGFFGMQRGETIDLRPDKPTRFERYNRFRCPRKRKKALKREIHDRLRGTESKEQLTQHYQEEWSLIRKEREW